MRWSAIYSVFFASAILQGCSYLEPFIGSTEKPKAAPSAVTSTDSPVDPARKGIVLTWEVPSEPVDGFVVRYGLKSGQLDRELKVPMSELKQEQDQEYGPVYRFTVPDVPAGKPVFAAIAAYKGDRLSDFTEVMPAR